MSLQVPNKYNPPPITSPIHDATVYSLVALAGIGLMIAIGMAGIAVIASILLVGADILPKLHSYRRLDS